MSAESDFAPAKPRCDLLFTGFAYAENGRRASAVQTSLVVPGLLRKTIDVFGPRVWTSGGGAPLASRALPFDRLPLHYGVAYGGVDTDPERPGMADAYYPNPVGVGHYPLTRGRLLDGKPLPSTAMPGQPVVSTSGRYRPMALGPLGRNFAERVQLAGTYDQHWLDNVFPFLPSDFQPAYYQAAPADQQIPYPHGGEVIGLINLTPEGQTSFAIPSIAVPVLFARSKLGDVRSAMHLDTIHIDGERRKVFLIWRAALPLRKNMFEVETVVVGDPAPGWLRARTTGKTYFRSLGALARARASAPVNKQDTKAAPGGGKVRA